MFKQLLYLDRVILSRPIFGFFISILRLHFATYDSQIPTIERIRVEIGRLNNNNNKQQQHEKRKPAKFE